MCHSTAEIVGCVTAQIVGYVTVKIVEYVTVHQSTSQYAGLCFSTSEYVTVRGNTSQYAGVRHSTREYVTVRQSTSQYVAVHHSTLEYVTVRQSTSQYVESLFRCATVNNLTKSPLCGDADNLLLDITILCFWSIVETWNLITKTVSLIPMDIYIICVMACIYNIVW